MDNVRIAMGLVENRKLRTTRALWLTSFAQMLRTSQSPENGICNCPLKKALEKVYI